LNALGRHLLLELKICNKEVLDDLDFSKIVLTKLPFKVALP